MMVRDGTNNYEVTPPPERLGDRVQMRIGFTANRGKVLRFIVQLEYWLEGEWREVVRYDHDAEASGGHDISEEGLHRDVYRDREKYRSERLSHPLPAKKGFDMAEEDLCENVERFIKRFEIWHGVRRTDEP